MTIWTDFRVIGYGHTAFGTPFGHIDLLLTQNVKITQFGRIIQTRAKVSVDIVSSRYQ
jgi:hypothetical protein